MPIAAPTEEERAQPYLWRFWRHIPGKGRVTIFDRSWYGRVLVERVEGFCSEQDWMRAYAEINDFEEQLANADILLMKFWLQISPEEQLKRFEERQQIPFKRFKITAVGTTLQVAAGYFEDCVEVEGTQDTKHPQTGERAKLVMTWTYAPGVGLVKAVGRVIPERQPAFVATTMELVSFTVNPTKN